MTTITAPTLWARLSDLPAPATAEHNSRLAKRVNLTIVAVAIAAGITVTVTSGMLAVGAVVTVALLAQTAFLAWPLRERRREAYTAHIRSVLSDYADSELDVARTSAIDVDTADGYTHFVATFAAVRADHTRTLVTITANDLAPARSTGKIADGYNPVTVTLT